MIPWKKLKPKQAGDGGSSRPSFVNVVAQIIYPRVKQIQQISPGEIQAVLSLTLNTTDKHNLLPLSFSGI